MAIKYKLHLLGPVMVTWETAEPPRFRSQLTMALLGYLAAEQRPVARDALATLLWPNEPLATGKANLRRELHNLSNILPGCWQTDRQIIALVPDRGTKVDIYDLLALEEAENWLEAADLIRGEFLEGLYLEDNIEFETWLLGERERWRQRAERIFRRAVGESVSAGDDTEALRHARRLLRLLPWHEEMHRQVMTLLAQRGQRSAALQQYELCKELLWEELGVEVSAETQALYERIRDTATFALHNIPAPTTPLIGREEEMSFLKDWLADPDIRLITITGPGGMGKTRLALGLAQEYLDGQAHPFTDGLYFVSLAALEDPSHIVSTIAAVLKFPFQSRDKRSPREQLLDYLQQKKMLLILDNFEHLLPGVEFITAVLAASPDIQILVTSRERLNLQGEQIFPLEGLAYDEEKLVDAITQTAAAQFFLTVAKRVQPAFMSGNGDISQLDRICHLVEGMPLALELAATWADTLSLAAIAGEIEKGLGFLETDTRDMAERHRSIEAVFDTAWQRLSPQEQAVFARLSVFRGGFTREAAEAVTGATAKVLSRLVNRSLLRYWPEKDRYDTQELIQQYARDKLLLNNASGVRDRHLAFFTSLAETIESKRGFEQAAGLDQLETDFANIRAALKWSLRESGSVHQGLRLAGALNLFWRFRGEASEGYKWLSQLIAHYDVTSISRTRAKALGVLGSLNYTYKGDPETAFSQCQESLEIYKLLGDRSGVIKTLINLSHLERYQSNWAAAEGYCEESLKLAIELDDQEGIVRSMKSMAWLKLEQKIYLDTAYSLFKQCLSMNRQMGDVQGAADSYIGLGHLATYQQKWSEARSWLAESLVILKKIGNKIGVSQVLNSLGEIERVEKDYERAEEYYKESLALSRELGNKWGTVIKLYNLGQTALHRGKVDQSVTYFIESLNLAYKGDYRRLINIGLEGLANLSSASNQPIRAAKLWGAAEAEREKVNAMFEIADSLDHDHFVKLARNQIDEHTFQAAWAEGREMPLEQAIDYALEMVAQKRNWSK